jgi:hypothetical protein
MHCQVTTQAAAQQVGRQTSKGLQPTAAAAVLEAACEVDQVIHPELMVPLQPQQQQ